MSPSTIFFSRCMDCPNQPAADGLAHDSWIFLRLAMRLVQYLLPETWLALKRALPANNMNSGDKLFMKPITGHYGHYTPENNRVNPCPAGPGEHIS